MSTELRFALGELLGLHADCRFLDEAARIDLVEGRLVSPRLEVFERHARDCSCCADLVADIEEFRALTHSGVTVASELRAFEASDADVRRRIARFGLRRRLRALFYWLSPALVAVVLAAVLLWPSTEPMIPALEPMPFVPPPAVRSADAGETWRRIETVWNVEGPRAAVAPLEDAIAGSPDDADLRFYLGHARLLTGDAEGALAELERAAALQPIASEHTRWMLAAAYDRLDRRDEACNALRSVVEIDGTRADTARSVIDRYCP